MTSLNALGQVEKETHNRGDIRIRVHTRTRGHSHIHTHIHALAHGHYVHTIYGLGYKRGKNVSGLVSDVMGGRRGWMVGECVYNSFLSNEGIILSLTTCVIRV